MARIFLLLHSIILQSITLSGYSYPELVKHVYEFAQPEEIHPSSFDSKPTFIFVIDANITQSDAQVLLILNEHY